MNTPDTVRVDMHIHTCWSSDTWTRPERILQRIEQYRTVDYICVTDHNEIGAALELAAVDSPVGVIVGEEIYTTHGEIAGLFLKEHVPPMLSPARTVELIKAQGGLVVVPHPLGRVVPSRLKADALKEIMADVDILEVYNSRNFVGRDDIKVIDLARREGKAMAAGSDAHFAFEIGRAFVEMRDFRSADEFLSSLRSGRLVLQKRTTPLVHCVTLPVGITRRRVHTWLRRPWLSVSRKLPPAPENGFRKCQGSEEHAR